MRERKKAEREEQVTRLPERSTINLLANGYAPRIIIQSLASACVKCNHSKGSTTYGRCRVKCKKIHAIVF